jgi:4-diphosphocytidyl-2-C-methyl-D-erythritol kinase
MMSSEIWQAPAKINLYLEITGRREDGYHTVDTAYQSIDLADTVVLKPAQPEPGVTCEVVGDWAEHVPRGEENLATRAARLIARFAVPDPEHTLIDVARELGADVPYFLQGGTRRGTGVGELLEAIDAPAERWGILVYPGVRVSTGWAYDAYDAAGTESSANALESVVVEKYPVVGQALGMLRSGPAAIAQMSGSGSAVFALYKSAGERDADIDRVNNGVGELADARVWPFECVDHSITPA